MIIILKMKNPENSEKIFNILNTHKHKYSLSINGTKKREKKQKNRKLNSLNELTKKFLQILFEEKKEIINLKEIVQKIKVKKRRIYDITNVLQGKF